MKKKINTVFKFAKNTVAPLAGQKGGKRAGCFPRSLSREIHESRAGASCNISMGNRFEEKFCPKVSGILLCGSVGRLQGSSVNVSLRVLLLQPLLTITPLRAASPRGLFSLLLCFRFHFVTFLSLT